MALCELTPIRIAKDRSFVRDHTFTECDGITPLDLTGYSFEMQIRKERHTDDPAMITLSTGNGKIVILSPATDGTIEITMTPAETAALQTGVFLYETKWTTPTGEEDTVMGGSVTVFTSVTR